MFMKKKSGKAVKNTSRKEGKNRKSGPCFFGRRGEEQGCDPIYTLVLE